MPAWRELRESARESCAGARARAAAALACHADPVSAVPAHVPVDVGCAAVVRVEVNVRSVAVVHAAVMVAGVVVARGDLSHAVLDAEVVRCLIVAGVLCWAAVVR